MLKKTVREIIGILILTLFLALLYHLILPSGLSILKKKTVSATFLRFTERIEPVYRPGRS